MDPSAKGIVAESKDGSAASSDAPTEVIEVDVEGDAGLVPTLSREDRGWRRIIRNFTPSLVSTRLGCNLTTSDPPW